MYKIALYILVMAVVTYLVRMLPFTLFRTKIKSRFFRSFLYYVPYAVLSAMTIPAIFYSTSSKASSAGGFIAALIASFFGASLLITAIIAAIAAYIISVLEIFL